VPTENGDLLMWLSQFSPGELAEGLKAGLPIVVVAVFAIVIGGTLLWNGIGSQLLAHKSIGYGTDYGDGGGKWWPHLTLGCLVAVALFLAFGSGIALGQGVSLPGSDESGQLEAAGTLIRIIDTGLFKWMARIMAGLCILSSGWALKEQRFGVAVICIVGAILFGTAPTWVANIFEIGGGDGLFSQSIEQIQIGVRSLYA
jgi:hypothetical protein